MEPLKIVTPEKGPALREHSWFFSNASFDSVLNCCTEERACITGCAVGLITDNRFGSDHSSELSVFPSASELSPPESLPGSRGNGLRLASLGVGLCP